jgi:phosphoribosylamine--glycine ligase
MEQTTRIGFAGTDARTLLSALVVSTAKSETATTACKGVVLRGTSSMPRLAEPDMQNWPVEFIPAEDTSVQAYARAAIRAMQAKELDYIVPLPEALLFDGLVDELEEAGFGGRIAGLRRDGAFLEADKIKCKEFCRQAGIPVADSWWEVDARDAQAVVRTCLQGIHEHGGVVLKYPYSAGGKGARVVLNTWEIQDVYQKLLEDYKKAYKKMFRNQPWPLLIESRMSGVEISFTILVDSGGNFCILPTSMDYPERFAGPPGPDNPITGGMGSISPHPFESPELIELVEESIARPMVQALRAQGILRPCVLYPGCFVSFAQEEGSGLKPVSIRVCEINIRPGEPEFQAVVRRMRNLGPVLQAMFTGELDRVRPEVREDQVALCVGLVTGAGGPDGQKGYPWSVTKFEPVELDLQGLAKKNIQLVPSGMGYSRERGLYSDGTRVAYLNINGTVKSGQSRGEVAERLRTRVYNAFDAGRVRVVPRENEEGNRLDLRRDIGSHFRQADQLWALAGGR